MLSIPLLGDASATWRRPHHDDTQNNDTQHNATQNKRVIICNTQHERHSITMLCHYAECRVLFLIMLNVIRLGVDMVNVVMLSVVAPAT